MAETPEPPTEREIKLAWEIGAVLPSMDDLSGDFLLVDRDVIDIEAAYWDTADLLLAARHIGIRRRHGRAWTYKGPSHRDGDAVVREEREWSDADSFPAALLDRLRAEVGAVDLIPVARLRTQRHRLDLCDERGQRVAEIDDDVVEILDGDTVIETFREVEVEVLDDAAPQAIADVVSRLVAAGAVVHTTGKYTRALRALGRLDGRE